MSVVPGWWCAGRRHRTLDVAHSPITAVTSALRPALFLQQSRRLEISLVVYVRNRARDGSTSSFPLLLPPRSYTISSDVSPRRHPRRLSPTSLLTLVAMIIHPEGPGRDFLIIISILLALSTIAITLRIWARLEIRAFWIDDWLMVAGWVSPSCTQRTTLLTCRGSSCLLLYRRLLLDIVWGRCSRMAPH